MMVHCASDVVSRRANAGTKRFIKHFVLDFELSVLRKNRRSPRLLVLSIVLGHLLRPNRLRVVQICLFLLDRVILRDVTLEGSRGRKCFLTLVALMCLLIGLGIACILMPVYNDGSACVWSGYYQGILQSWG